MPWGLRSGILSVIPEASIMPNRPDFDFVYFTERRPPRQGCAESDWNGEIRDNAG